jgi:hypothetical protein
MGDPSRFYGSGVYTFLRVGDSITVYRQNEHHIAEFLGHYDQIELPASLPPIAFPPGIDQIMAVPEEAASARERPG